MDIKILHGLSESRLLKRIELSLLVDHLAAINTEKFEDGQLLMLTSFDKQMLKISLDEEARLKNELLLNEQELMKIENEIHLKTVLLQLNHKPLV